MTRRGRAWALALTVVAACAGAPSEPPRIARAVPDYGPVVGGTRIVLTGAGFAADGAGPNRVLIGGRAAPLVATVDDATLEVVIPPGAQPGAAELVVWNANGTGAATGLFRYSTPPTLTAIEPATVLFNSSATRVTVSGHGFVDDGAGAVTVVVGGQLATEVDVLSDTTLTFTAPAGRALSQPELELVDARGRAIRPRAFRYVPSTRGGLLLFPRFGAFAVFFDPVDHTVVTIPRIGGPAVRFTAVVRDPRGDYWGADRSLSFGRIDLTAQRLEAPIPTAGWFPTMIRIGAAYVALERESMRFGRFEPATGAFTPIGDASIPCCGSYGLASNGTTYVTARQGAAVSIAPIDLVTGAVGPPVTIDAPPGFHVEEMRFFAGTLYAATRAGTLVTIDPITGATTVLPVNLGRFSAMEVFE